VEELQRADIKTRYEVYEKAIALGVKSPEQVAGEEGLLGASGGSIARDPIPLRAVS
jgi:hypothetical protein